MGLFSFLSKNTPAYTVSDKIWVSQEESLRGIGTEALTAITRGEIPIILSFFEDSQKQVLAYLQHQQAPVVEMVPSNANQVPAKTIICLDAWLAVHSLTHSTLDKTKITFLLYGHYPLIAPEDTLLNELHQLTGTPKFTSFFSLDHPLMAVFGSDQMKSLMLKMGIKKDECIQHSMVSRSVVRARQKISESVKQEFETTSEIEWYVKNIRKPS